MVVMREWWSRFVSAYLSDAYSQVSVLTSIALLLIPVPAYLGASLDKKKPQGGSPASTIIHC